MLANATMGINVFQGFERQTKLHWVKIYFATPTFNLVTKDEKANFEDKLSSIGGTMGLFTGFSILSAMEIIYFAGKALIVLVRKLLEKKNRLNIDKHQTVIVKEMDEN